MKTIGLTLLLLAWYTGWGQKAGSVVEQGAQTADPRPSSTHPSGDYATVNGAKLWYESEGSGPPLLLIAGGPGLPHSYFHPHFSQLANSYRVIYFDAFGTGRSDRATESRQYTFARDVENVEGLRKALGLGKINLIGHSYGGMVAQAFALRFPDSVEKLILVDTSWGAEMSHAHRENWFNEMRNQFPDTWEKKMKAHEKGFHTCSKEFLTAAKLPPDFEASLLFFNPTLMQKLAETAEPGNNEVNCAIQGDDAGFAIGGDMANLDFRTQLKDLRMPMLIVAGRFDRILFPRYQEQFKIYAPQAQFVFFEKSGHFPFIEEPEKFIELVRGFLQK
jgi:proline iminopeptidase